MTVATTNPVTNNSIHNLHDTLSPNMSAASPPLSEQKPSVAPEPSIPPLNLHHRHQPTVPSTHNPLPSITRSTFHDSNLVIKCRYGNNFRRIPILKQDGDLTYDGLCVMVHRVFKSKLPSISNPTNIILKYADEDGDLITLENDSDLVHALPLKGNGTLKVTIYANEQEANVGPCSSGMQELSQDLKSLELSSKLIPVSERDYDLVKEELTKVMQQIQSLLSRLEKKTKPPMSAAEADDLLKQRPLPPSQHIHGPPSQLPPSAPMQMQPQQEQHPASSPRMGMPPMPPSTVPHMQFMKPQTSQPPVPVPGPMQQTTPSMPPPGPGMPVYHRPPMPPQQQMGNPPSMSGPGAMGSPYHQPPQGPPYGSSSTPTISQPMMPPPPNTAMSSFPQQQPQQQQYQYPPPPSFLNRPN